VIDIHSHILPEIDDGALSLDDSVAMLDEMARLGFHTIVATPHLTGELTAAYDDAVTRAHDAVRPLAAERGIELVRGFEIRLSPDLPTRLRGGEPITIGDSTAVLVDLPPSGWLYDLDEVLFNVQASGFQPVLAHPERYPMLQKRPRHGRELAERRGLLQVTVGNYDRLLGRWAKKAAEALLHARAVHVVATDAHSAMDRLLSVLPALRRSERPVGTAALQPPSPPVRQTRCTVEIRRRNHFVWVGARGFVACAHYGPDPVRVDDRRRPTMSLDPLGAVPEGRPGFRA
jgi:protein-tyrosine phosphatase